MRYLKRIKCAILAELVLFAAAGILWGIQIVNGGVAVRRDQAVEVGVFEEKTYIKWVDFNVSYEALCEAYKWDTESWKEAAENKDAVHVDWIELLAYAGARYGGEFPSKAVSEITKTAKKLTEKETTMEELTKGMEYNAYYLEAYQAVLSGYVGEYEIQKADGDGKVKWQKCYGLKAFSPVAKGFEYTDYDDFGASRSYGYARPHLGHDMMGQTGTPIQILYRITH